MTSEELVSSWTIIYVDAFENKAFKNHFLSTENAMLMDMIVKQINYKMGTYNKLRCF